LLETPNVETRAISSEARIAGTFNDHPFGVPPSGGKRGARKRDDMVCPAWRHAAVHKRTGAELASRAEQKVKRAGFKWGIGRELYTAPRIWVGAELCNVKQGRNGKPQCYDDFRVTEMAVEDGQIVKLTVANMSRRGVIVFGQGKGKKETPKDDPLEAAKQALWTAMKAYAAKCGRDPKDVYKDAQKRPEWESQQGSAEWLMSVAREYEELANG